MPATHFCRSGECLQQCRACWWPSCWPQQVRGSPMSQMAHPGYRAWPRAASVCVSQRNGHCLTADPPLYCAGLGVTAAEGDGGSLCFNQLQVRRTVLKAASGILCWEPRGGRPFHRVFVLPPAPSSCCSHSRTAYATCTWSDRSAAVWTRPLTRGRHYRRCLPACPASLPAGAGHTQQLPPGAAPGAAGQVWGPDLGPAASMAVQPARADCPAGHRCVAAAGLAEVCRRLALHRTAFRRPRPLPQPAWPAELLS